MAKPFPAASNRDRALGLDLRCDVSELEARIELPPSPSAKARRIMAAIVADAILSARRDPERRISYSRRNGRWHKTRRYRHPDFSYYTVVPTIDALVEAGILIDHGRLQPTVAALVLEDFHQGVRADLQLHQLLGGKPDHLMQQIGVGALLNERAQVHHVVGHRWSFHQVGLQQPDPTGKALVTADPPTPRSATSS